MGLISGLFIQLGIGVVVLLVSRADAPKGYWKMSERMPKGDIRTYERDVLKGVTKETPNGVSDGALYDRIYQLKRSSLGVGWGLGLIMTSIFWLGTIYLSDGGLNGN
jgi:hypothetical protein